MIRAALRRPSGMVGLVLVGLALLAATLGPVLYGASPLDGDLDNRHHGVSKAFPLGADFLGRDQLARILRKQTDEVLQRVGIHSERGPLTLERMLTLAGRHIPHHLPFIEEKRKALGLPPAGSAAS